MRTLPILMNAFANMIGMYVSILADVQLAVPIAVQRVFSFF